MHKIRVIAQLSVLVSVMFLMAGCITSALPPGYVRSGMSARASFPLGTKPEVVFSLLEWYSGAHGADMSSELMADVTQAKEDAALPIYRAWAKKIMEMGAPLVRLDNASIELVPAVFTQTQSLTAKNGFALIDDLKNKLEAPIEIEIPLEDALSPSLWRNTYGKYRTAFSEWARRNRTVIVPDPKLFNRKELIRDLMDINSVLVARSKMLEALRVFDADKNGGNTVAMLDLFTAVNGELPEKLTLKIIEDVTTEARFKAVLRSIPENMVNDLVTKCDNDIKELRNVKTVSLENAEHHLFEAESALSSGLRSFEKDDRFSQALLKYKRSIYDICLECARIRGKIYAEIISKYGNSAQYWQMAQEFSNAWHGLEAKADSEFWLYEKNGNFSQIKSELLKEYYKFLPAAAAEYMNSAENALNVSNKYGVSVALCTLLERIFDLPEGASSLLEPGSEITDWRAKMVQLKEKAIDLVKSSCLQSSVSIGDFTSSIPGLGLTISRDLVNELGKALEMFGLSEHVTISEPGTKPRKWGYVGFGGHVANFDGNETSERMATHALRRIADVRCEDNPEFRQDAPADATKSQRSRKVYLQDIQMQVVKVKEVEKIAHIRIFMDFRGPGFTHRVEVNEFYKKLFSIETSHPFDDVKLIETRKYYDLTEAEKVTPELDLRYDRIWTAGEMLDWGRRDSVRMMALLLAYHIADYPLYISESAKMLSKNGKYTDAVDLLGQCYVLLQSVDVEKDSMTTMVASSPQVAKAFEKFVEELRRQSAEISVLKGEITKRIIEEANRLPHK